MKFSIIIPTLNEEKNIEKTIRMVKNFRGNKEIIIVDGGSLDKTADIVNNIPEVKLIKSKKGRALQMNVGAQNAQGDVLLFLHSDSILGAEALIHIEKKLKNLEVVGGGFRLNIEDSRMIFKVICWGSNIRAKYSKVFFGDQGIFVRKNIFFKVGGYPNLEIMEDWEFSRLLKKEGKLIQIPYNITTSARRWNKNGIWKTIFLMHKLKILYKLGVSPKKLKKMYSDVR